MKDAFILTMFTAMLVAGCGKPDPGEYLAKAKMAMDSSKYAIAIEECENLIKEHPASPEADEAMFLIATARNDAMRDFPGAVEAYKRYLTAYPQGKKAPLALFMTGYVCNNELHDYTAARAAYEQFLATYPDHEMAISAKFELENLGKKPEDLLPALQDSPPQTAAQTSKHAPAKKK